MANQATVVRIRILVIVLVTLAGVGALLWLTSRRSGPDVATINPPERSATPVESPHVVSSSPTPHLEPATPSPTVAPGSPSPNASASPTVPPASDLTSGVGFVGTLKLIVPVVGVRPDQLQDTFTDARSEGRSHDAIDITAPLGTSVVAVADGEIVKLFQSERGGTMIYQLSVDKKLVYYYAHLQGYADGLVVGKVVKQGEVIGYVGDTGNAGPGNFHLHFSISIVPDPKRYWEGTNINPYPLLHK